MKYLCRQTGEVLRKGDFVKADKSVCEFIFDTESNEITVKTLQLIAQSNKIRVTAKTKADYLKQITEALDKMNDIAQQNEQTKTELVEQIVRDGFENGRDDDSIMIAIVHAGVSFRAAGKLFKEAVEKLGYRTSTKDVKALAQKLLAEIEFKGETADEVERAINLVHSQAGENVERGQAVSAVKHYAKVNEITLAMPSKAQTGAGGFRGRVYQFILDNPQATESELRVFLSKGEKDADKLLKHYSPILKLCRKFANKHASADIAA